MELYDYLGSAIRKLSMHVQVCDFSGSREGSADLGEEVVERLKQADWLFRRAVALDDQMRGAMERVRTLDAYSNEARFELQLHTECFYYIAARACDILQNGWIPRVSQFDCPAIRQIRNLLIEHSEKGNSRNTMRSWGFGSRGGPVLKPMRRGDSIDVFRDAGLFVNALDFEGSSSPGRARRWRLTSASFCRPLLRPVGARAAI